MNDRSHALEEPLPRLDQVTQGTAIPQRVPVSSSVLSLPLTHRQRVIYFLVDGQRTIAHIAQCCQRGIAETEAVLSELRHLGLIF